MICGQYVKICPCQNMQYFYQTETNFVMKMCSYVRMRVGFCVKLCPYSVKSNIGFASIENKYRKHFKAFIDTETHV